MSLDAFRAFEQIVFADLELLERLRRSPAMPDLFALVVSEAKSRGLDVSEGDLRAAIDANHRGWIERELYR